MASDSIRLAGGPTERAAGEHVAELFQEHGRMVYGLCGILLRDPVEADDATQATFVSAFKALLGGGTVREPAAWLATIARNECRARAHARMREPLPLRDDDVGHAREPHDEVNRRIAAEEIREAIAELPEKQREAVVLRDLYGLRYDEVGAALGLSRPSVEALLFRGRRRLRVSLKPLASGALVVPIAVREGIAQALPGFAASATGTGALAGGVTASAVGGGLFAKLAAVPVAAKMAAAAVAVGAAGSVGVVEAERGTGGRDTVQTVAQEVSAGASTSVPDAPLRVGSGGGDLRDDDERSAVSARAGGDAEESGGHNGDHAQRAGSGAGEADEDLEPAGASKERRDANDDGEHAARTARTSEATDDAEPEGEAAKGATRGRTEKSEKPESDSSGFHDGRDVGSATLEQPESHDSGDEPEAVEPEQPESSGASESDHSGDEPEETEPPA